MTASLSNEPTPERIAAWIELSELFVGRELEQADFRLIAERLRSTKLSIVELERTLWDEVEPVFGGNIGVLNPTPEMEGWSASGVEDAMRKYLERPRGPLAASVRRWMTSQAVHEIPRDRWARVQEAMQELDDLDRSS